MVNSIRKSIERLYTDSCIIYELQGIKDEVTGITQANNWVAVHQDISCKLSSKNVVQAVRSDMASKITKVVKLYIAPEIEIKPGSKIEVTSRGKKYLFRNSGLPAMRTNHQEVALELWGEKA
jgi:hypothetical protein